MLIELSDPDVCVCVITNGFRSQSIHKTVRLPQRRQIKVTKMYFQTYDVRETARMTNDTVRIPLFFISEVTLT